MDFMIGGLAGAGATIITNPMDVVKTRMQLQGELRARGEHSVHYRNIIHAMYTIAKTDGVNALQKGLTPALVLGCVLNGIRLGLYHIAEKKDWTKNDDGVGSIPKMWFWGSAGGIVSGVVINPVSVVKTRIQSAAHPSIAVGRQHRYNGLWDGLTTIYRTESVRGCYAGVNAICWRLGIGSAAQLTSFSAAKDYLSHNHWPDSPVKVSVVASVASSFFVVCVETPLDVVNTRLYNQGRNHTQLYNGVWDCLRKIWKTEGIHGLYKGVGPFYFRLAPHTTISLVIWDVLNNNWNGKNIT